MGKWPRPGTGQPPAPEPSKNDCDACKGFGGQYEKNELTFEREWVNCKSCGGSGKK